jgi:serine-type D-Ala-D-Ala carboxypeptidase (penicillin-binding protein 5/6)
MANRSVQLNGARKTGRKSHEGGGHLPPIPARLLRSRDGAPEYASETGVDAADVSGGRPRDTQSYLLSATSGRLCASESDIDARVESTTIEHRRERRRARGATETGHHRISHVVKRPRLRWVGLGVLLVVAALAVNELRPVGPVPALQSIGRSTSAPGAPTPAPWPGTGEGAIGALDEGVLAASPDPRPQPIASVAKVMTALVVLDEKPLKPGETGPAVTVGPDDVTEFQQEKAGGESVLPVQAGEQLTEYQALQGLLVPSGNNVASLLARWASGSVDAHVQRMNARARSMGLRRTAFADVSGLSDRTVSIPADLVRLGQAALAEPVLADIVQQAQASLPVAGTVYNVNYALGQDGILGIKTGNIAAGGAIYLFAAAQQLASGTRVTLIGAVQGLPTLDAAFAAAKALLDAARTSLQTLHVVSRDQTVGGYELPWGGATDVVAAQDLDILVWPGTIVRMELHAQPVAPPVSPRTTVGSLHVTAGDAVFDVPVANTDQLYGPGRLARLTRVTW